MHHEEDERKTGKEMRAWTSDDSIPKAVIACLTRSGVEHHMAVVMNKYPLRSCVARCVQLGSPCGQKICMHAGRMAVDVSRRLLPCANSENRLGVPIKFEPRFRTYLFKKIYRSKKHKKRRHLAPTVRPQFYVRAHHARIENIRCGVELPTGTVGECS